GVPCFADKFSRLFDEEQRFGSLCYPFMFIGNFRPYRKLDLLLTGLARLFKTHLANKCDFVQKEISKKTPPALF
ncbi:MAG: hypothetical protein ACRENG_18200, partial [bacterium]